MPVEINGQTYYRTAEVYREVGISKNTLYNWLKKGILGKAELRDVRGWRIFTLEDVETIKSVMNHISDA